MSQIIICLKDMPIRIRYFMDRHIAIYEESDEKTTKRIDWRSIQHFEKILIEISFSLGELVNKTNHDVSVIIDTISGCPIVSDVYVDYGS